MVLLISVRRIPNAKKRATKLRKTTHLQCTRTVFTQQVKQQVATVKQRTKRTAELGTQTERNPKWNGLRSVHATVLLLSILLRDIRNDPR